MTTSKMMDMLHAIRKNHWEQIKLLNREERVAAIHAEAAMVMKSFNALHPSSKVEEKGSEYGANSAKNL